MKILHFLLIPYLAVAVNAANIQILPMEGSGIDDALKSSAYALTRHSISESGNNPVDSSAEQTLHVSLLRLGNAYLVVAEHARAGKVIGSAQLKAEKAEELDVVLTRTINSALQNKPAQTSETVGNITQEEVTEEQRRKETHNYKSFGIAPAFLFGMDPQSISYQIHSGYLWEVSPNAALEFRTDDAVHLIDWAAHLTMLLGGRYYFSSGRISPYVGAGLGIGFAADSSRSYYGFALGGSFGLVMFRTSSAQLDIIGNVDAIISAKDAHPATKAGVGIALNY